MTQIANWDGLVRLAAINLRDRKLGDDYKKRLAYEIKEINKQGANRYWIKLYNDGKKYDTNKNGLVLPFLLDITSADPINSEWQYIISNEGVDMDILEIILDDGRVLNIPALSSVYTPAGLKLAKNLQIGDEL